MKKYAPLFVITAAALWGIDGILLTPSLYSLPVPIVVLLQASIISVILLPVFFKNKSEIFNSIKTNYLLFLGIAILGGAIGTMAITKALFYVNYVNLSIVILIQKLQPLFAIILARIILKETLSKFFFQWSFIAIIGTYLMTFGTSLPILTTGDKTLLAALFALLAALSFAASTVISKKALIKTSFQSATFLRFIITAVIMMFIVLSNNQIESIYNVTADQWIILLIIAITTGGSAIFLYYYGLKEIPASVATICELAFPFTAILLEYIVRGNILDPIQWIGAFLLFIGIFRVTRLYSV